MRRYAYAMPTLLTHTITLLLCASLAACASERIEVLKSPCAGLEGSPCGPKRLINGPLNPHAAPAGTTAPESV